MIKNAIAPIQAWLLSQGRCVACGRELSAQKKKAHKKHGNRVDCSCGRVFFEKSGRYRRALMSEI